MMSDTTLGFLSTLTYRADAERTTCWLPVSGIYWEDEMPNFSYLMNLPEDDKHEVFRLFLLRVRLWKGVQLSDTDQQFWDTTYSRVPNWAFFRRRQISDEDLYAQEQAEHGAAEFLETWLADAHQVTISEKDGVQKFSAKFRLGNERGAPEKKRSWWERLFTRRPVRDI